ncbi:MAG: rhomboid family intramembrane serine protease [Calditrichaeota bacterium]|nr:MAG: rhomboid family intramembrane serine protease [Calditrichota bacterium]MBL1206889.1 rhomboid family intramembrane serine protease [Calditrichota bacterium]NOG46715.1 rhomboid family intramembrane serine protease [Calditrichota bacterium]
MNKESFFQAVKIVLFAALAIWLIEIVNLILGHQFYVWGILPRDFDSLPGIILHPFIHGSLQHTILNTIPFIVLGSFVALEGKAAFIKITVQIVLIGGLLLWLFGRSSYHVGASLLIFGYFGFLLSLAFYKKTISSIVIAGVTIFMYGGLIYGIVPMDNQVSWEGHLFGLIAGVFGARLTKPGSNA